MVRFIRSGTEGEIHGSTSSSARSTEFGLRFLVCHINQNALDRFDNRGYVTGGVVGRSMCFPRLHLFIPIIYTFCRGCHHQKTS